MLGFRVDQILAAVWVLFVVFWAWRVIAGARVARTRLSEVMGQADRIADRAHADALRSEGLLTEIRDELRRTNR